MSIKYSPVYLFFFFSFIPYHPISPCKKTKRPKGFKLFWLGSSLNYQQNNLYSNHVVAGLDFNNSEVQNVSVLWN